MITIPTARAFESLLQPARYKGAHGGRGSGKSHFFAELLVEECLLVQPTYAVGIREVQRTLADSSKLTIEKKIESMDVGHLFTVQHDRILTPGGGRIIFQGLKDATAESIKSLEGYRIAWADEAHNLSRHSLSLLRPTIRVPRSQLWFSWNPDVEADAIEDLLRTNRPEGAIVVEANWRDNPWWNDDLESERAFDLEHYPEEYEHKWEGGYVQAFEGAYYATLLHKAKQEARICELKADPALPLKAFWDIGGAGKTSDAMAIWIVQFARNEIRLLDYIEGQGQTLSHYMAELRDQGYEKIRCYLPHDGVNANNVTGKRLCDHLEEGGFPTETIPNQGVGAAKMRIEALRRLFPSLLFDDKKTEHGRRALGYYHEKKDQVRKVGMGPVHDWSSHAADAAGLMAIKYEDDGPAGRRTPIAYPKVGYA